MIGIRFIAISLLFLPAIATSQFRPQIPKAWDEEALKEFELPLAGLGHSPTHVSSDYYYRIPVTAIPKTYPVYSPDREPPGYLAWLKQQEPQSAVEFENLQTKDDWIHAGELVFNAPFRVAEGVSAELFASLQWWGPVSQGRSRWHVSLCSLLGCQERRRSSVLHRLWKLPHESVERWHGCAGRPRKHE